MRTFRRQDRFIFHASFIGTCIGVTLAIIGACGMDAIAWDVIAVGVLMTAYFGYEGTSAARRLR
jgi:hypothetical protein